MTQRWLYHSRWLVNFFLFFTLALALIGAPYLAQVNWTQLSAIEWTYLITTQIGWFGVFSLLLCIGLWLIAWLPSRGFKTIAVVIAFALLLLLKIDLTTFEHYKFHINALLISMFLDAGSDVFELSWMSWLLFALSMVPSMLAIALAVIASNRLSQHRALWQGVLAWFVILLASQGIHAVEHAKFNPSLSQYNNQWPVYYPLTARKYLYSHGWVDQVAAEKQRLELKPIQTSALNYPRGDLHFTAKAKQPNVLFILIDAWRIDDVNAAVMPHVSEFIPKTNQFKQHFSGGNSTQAGMFSLFYSIPATYWNSFQASQTPPLFITQLQQAGYRPMILGSAPLTSPPLSRTVFKSVPNLRLRTPGENQVERDARITQDFIDFTKQPSDQPYFGMLFYDSAHGTEFPEKTGSKFKPYWSRVDHMRLNNDFDPNLYHNRYKNALYYIDGLIEQVLAHVDLSNTIVVISSDHGEEFNDHHQNYWGHSGNYSHTQLQVPLFVYIPDQKPQVIDYRTTHYDLVPTLLNQLFDVQGNTDAYSVGHDLFSPTPSRDWFIAGSYYNYAIITPELIMVADPTGQSRLMNDDLILVRDQQMPRAIIQQALTQMAQFYQ
ncbi:Inner membrane protein YejM [Vibrio stylophorae]|uniref:Inner membrane protein YejM n=1 Tax=Vibrio stylophorae TaxID=659351 RepID=A0ABM8ZQA4_9VIBR|nr:DUF3413 domain-containing protein [Vibrio stylophorae]CAH0532465.1 Inner membrane protein YejM [Vibrio stylophorae]